MRWCGSPKRCTRLRPPAFPVVFELDLGPGSTSLRVRATIYYCETDDEAVCAIRDVNFDIPVEVGVDGAASINASHELPEVKIGSIGS